MQAEDAQMLVVAVQNFVLFVATQYHRMLRLIGVCYYVYHHKLFICLLHLVTFIGHT